MSVDDDRPDDGADPAPIEASAPAAPATDPALAPSASMSLNAIEEEGASLADRAWHAAATLGELGVDVTRQVAHALGPSSPYHRHDFLVIAAAIAVVVAGGAFHRSLVRPPVEV